MDWFYADGSDSKGPHDAAQMARLLAQGRIHGETLVWHAGMAEWAPLRSSGLLDGFQDAPAPVPAAAAGPAPAAPQSRSYDLSDELPAGHPGSALAGAPASLSASEDESGDTVALAGAARSGAQWLYWIAGLSVLNLVLIAVQSPVSMALGLGITDLVYYFAVGMVEEGGPSSLPMIAIAIDLVLIALVAGMGWLAVRGNKIVYLLGTVLIILDGLLFIFPLFSIIGLAVHAYAAYAMVMGLLCLWKARPAPEPAV